MNFKHPSLWALFASLGAVLLGSYAFWAATDYASALPRSIGFTIVMLSFWLAAFGVFGSIASLIWWLVTAVVSKPRSHQTQKLGGGAFMASRLAKALKNPFVIGFFISLLLMGAGYFCLCNLRFFHDLVAHSSYSGLEGIFTFLFFPFCLFVYYAGKIYAIGFLVVGLIYAVVKNIGRTKHDKQS
jgi:hypothetical protein